jgi:hypothetical protein
LPGFFDENSETAGLTAGPKRDGLNALLPAQVQLGCLAAFSASESFGCYGVMVYNRYERAA